MDKSSNDARNKSMCAIVAMMRECVEVARAVQSILSHILLKEVIWEDCPEHPLSEFRTRVWGEDHAPFHAEVFIMKLAIGFCPYYYERVRKTLLDHESDPEMEQDDDVRYVMISVPRAYSIHDFKLETVKEDDIPILRVVHSGTGDEIKTVLWSNIQPRLHPMDLTFNTEGGRLLPDYLYLGHLQQIQHQIVVAEADPHTVITERVDLKLNELQSYAQAHADVMSQLIRKKDGMAKEGPAERVITNEKFEYVASPWIVSQHQMVRPQMAVKLEDVEARFLRKVACTLDVSIRMLMGESRDDKSYTSQFLLDEERKRRHSWYAQYAHDIAMDARVIMYEAYGEMYDIPEIGIRSMVDIDTALKIYQAGGMDEAEMHAIMRTTAGLPAREKKSAKRAKVVTLVEEVS